MKIKQLNKPFSVCKIPSLEHINLMNDFTFLAKTDDEISLVCETKHVPPSATDVENGWQAVKICGVLDFGLIGIIAEISSILADNKIPVFVVSTYNTDYILIKDQNYPAAVDLLRENEYELL